jgi:hypothetical protein
MKEGSEADDQVLSAEGRRIELTRQDGQDQLAGPARRGRLSG